jgi:hypothetical protein
MLTIWQEYQTNLLHLQSMAPLDFGMPTIIRSKLDALTQGKTLPEFTQCALSSQMKSSFQDGLTAE